MSNHCYIWNYCTALPFAADASCATTQHTLADNQLRVRDEVKEAAASLDGMHMWSHTSSYVRIYVYCTHIIIANCTLLKCVRTSLILIIHYDETCEVSTLSIPAA